MAETTSVRSNELSREEAIRQEAVRLFQEKGYEATALRELARGVGIEAPSLYNHFPSKYELLAKLLIGVMEELIDEIRVALGDAADDPVDQLRTAIRAYVLFHEDRLGETSISDTERRALRGAEALRLVELRDELGSVFKDIIERGQRAGVFIVDDLSLTTILILSVCARLPVWYRPGARLTLNEIAGLTADFALRALGFEPIGNRGRRGRR